MAKSLPRVKEVSWRVYIGAMPTRVNLQNRKIDVDLSCFVCGEEEETFEHLFLRYNISRSCWFVKLGIRVEPGTLLIDFIRKVLVQRDVWFVTEVQNMLYCLWEARNKLLFEERNFDFTMIIARMKTLGYVALLVTR